ncbi:hypothetical protein Tco_0587790 [Tanacetum coccineum]
MSHSTISIPSDSARKSIESSPSLVILSDTEAEVLAIPVALPSIAPKAATTTVVSLPTATGDLAIRTDLEAEPSKALPFPDYSEPIEDPPKAAEPLSAQIAPLPPVQISATLPTSPTMPASVGLSRKRCRSPPPASAVPPPDVSSPHKRSSLPPSDTTAEAVIPEFVIPKAMALVFLVRRGRLVEARCWTFVRYGIETWRHQEGEPRYMMKEGCSTQIQPINSEPIHRIVPLLVARHVRIDRQIEEIPDHQREAQVAVLRGLLRISRVRIADLEFWAEDAEDRLEQCEREWIHDRVCIRRFEEHLGIRQ